ncbi:MAG: alpha-E domain-containing protein, partial [Verrucomicrobia bacterium]
ERLEQRVRLLRAVVHRLGGESTHDGHAELAALVQMLVWLGQLPDRFGSNPDDGRLGDALVALVHQPQRVGNVRDILGKLRFLTTAVRDRLSNDTWRIFQRMQVDGHLAGQRPALQEVPGVLNTLIVDLAAFSGMEMENMTRGHAWRFLDIGRRIERGLMLVQLWRAALAAGGFTTTVLAPLLEIADSTMTYRRRYFEQMHLGTVLDLLLAEETNPRSLAFQLESLHEHLDFLPREVEGRGTPEERELMALSEALQAVDVPALAESTEALDALLARLAEGLCRLSDHLTHHYFSHAVLRAS